MDRPAPRHLWVERPAPRHLWVDRPAPRHLWVELVLSHLSPCWSHVPTLMVELLVLLCSMLLLAVGAPPHLLFTPGQ